MIGRWTHACCPNCFQHHYATVPNQVPVRVKHDPTDPFEPCCFCGSPTDGIYVRENPARVHPEDRDRPGAALAVPHEQDVAALKARGHLCPEGEDHGPGEPAH